MTNTPDEYVVPDPPKVIGDSVTFIGGSSGKPITATRERDDLVVLTDPEHPDYRGYLIQDGVDSYELRTKTGPGSVALGGIGIDWKFLTEHF